MQDQCRFCEFTGMQWWRQTAVNLLGRAAALTAAASRFGSSVNRHRRHGRVTPIGGASSTPIPSRLISIA